MRQCGIWEDYKILEYKDLNKNCCYAISFFLSKLLKFFVFLGLVFLLCKPGELSNDSCVRTNYTDEIQ